MSYELWSRGYELMFPNRHKYTAYLAECPDYKPSLGVGSKRIYGDEPAETPKPKTPRVPEEDGSTGGGRSLAERLLAEDNGPEDLVANGLGAFRKAEDDQTLTGTVASLEVRVNALLDVRLKALTRGVRELEEWKEKARTALRRQDATIARHEELLKRHEAICKTSYWAVQRLREAGTLPEARSAGQAAVDAAATATRAYATANGEDY